MKRPIRPLSTNPAGCRAFRRQARRKGFLPKAIAFAVASCFVADAALANPNGFSVVNGQVTFSYNGQVLTITNTPGSIINWQSFSIGVGEITRFIQQSAASSVLNRVTGIDPSIILGALQSNGRVFLINPNGILFGAGAQIDVAGLVASTLNLSNADFLAGRLRFTETPGAGSLVNQGAITTPSGGQVYLIAPNVENSGIITSPQGEIILAAGRSVEIVDAGTPGLRVEITAPDTEAVNVGQIIANSGKIGIYAGLIRNSGVIKADGVVVGQNGEILLKATNNVQLEAGGVISASGTANGIGGGNITVEGGTVTNAGTVQANAADNATAGNISMVAQNNLTLDATSVVEAKGAEVNSTGGTVYFYSYGDAFARNGQVIDISGGTQSGNAGSGEFSASNFVAFGGTLLGNAAPGFQKGNFLIDPVNFSFLGGVIGANLIVQAEDNITIDGNATINSGVTLTLLADHSDNGGTPVPGIWDTGGGGGTVGVGSITNTDGASTITGTDNTSSLVMYAGGGGIGDVAQPILTNMNGGSITANTNNPDQFGAANTFISNGFSDVNIAGFNDGGNGNSFVLTTGGAVTQTGLITAAGLGVSAGGSVDLPLANMVDTLAGNANGNFTFTNAQSLTVGTVGGLVGVTLNSTASDGAININVTSGDLTVNQAVRAFSSYYRAAVNLTAAGSIFVNSTTVSASNSFNGGASVALIATAGNIEITNTTVSADANYDGATVTLDASTGITVDNSLIRATTRNGLAEVTLTTTGANAEINITNSNGVNGIYAAGGDGGEGSGSGTGRVVLDATGNITVSNSVISAIGVVSGGSGSFDLDAPVAEVKLRSDKVVSITGSTLSAVGSLMGDGGEGGTININAPIAAVNITGENGVIITDAEDTISANATLSIVNSWSDATFDVNVNDSLAAVNITGNGTGPDSGVTITGSTITVDANVFADAGSNNLTVNFNVAAGAPLAAVNINGTGVKGVTIDSSTITVRGRANGYLGSGSSESSGSSNRYGYLNVGGTVGAPLAAVKITGTGTGAATSGVTITNGSTITVTGEMNANAYASGSAYGTVDINNTLNAPLAEVKITGNGGTTNGVTISGSTITVNGSLNAGSSENQVTGVVNFASTLNAPLALLDISSGSGVSISGTGITVSGALSAYASGGSVDFWFTHVNAPLAQIDISGNGGDVNGVTLAMSTVTANASLADGAEGFSGPAAAVHITSTAGDINIPGSEITASADDGGLGIMTSHILLRTTNGYIRGDADSLLTASNTACCGPWPLIEMRATSGIGEVGNPIIFANNSEDIIAVNSGATGDVALALATGDINIDEWTGGVSDISNSAPGGAIDLTALGRISGGNIIVRDTVSNPNGRLTLRAAGAGGLGGGTITVDGGEGAGMLTTGIGGGNDITLIADNIDIIAPSGSVVQSGSGFINVMTYSAGRPIWLGALGGGGAQLELSNAELNGMTALGGSGGGLVIGDPSGGPLVFKGPVDSSAFLNVRGSTITQIGGATITGGLNVIADGDVTLTDGGNQIDYFTTGFNVGGNITLVTSTDVGLYGVSASGNVNITSSTGAITNPDGALLHAGGTTALNAVTGIGTAANPILIDMGGLGFSATNNTSGDIAVASNAATFTVGGGGATFSNSGGGGYYISALNNMQLNGGSAGDGYAQFAAGGTLTVDGYSNSSGFGTLMLANNVTFSGGMTDVAGGLGVIGGTINVNTTVEADTINVVTNTLNVNGGDFRAVAGNFTGYVSGDITVSGGGRIYGNPDVDLTVGGTIFINHPGSKIEAASVTSIHVLFPLLADGGYLVNGAPVVWDELNGTGFFADGLPAVLSQNLLIVYGGAHIPPPPLPAELFKDPFAPDKDEDEDKDKDEKKDGDKAVTKGLKLQCN